MKKIITLLLALSLVLMTMAGCADEADTKTQETDTTTNAQSDTTDEDTSKDEEPSEQEAKAIILATTTSTRDSGLLDHILSDFTEQSGIEVKVVAVGTGKALQMGRDGEADCLLVHAKSSEETFVAEGYGVERFDVMYNDFVVVGPAADPADLKTKAPNDVVAAFNALYDTESNFISRGDDSGTNKKEISLWETAGITFDTEAFYVSAGKGMGDVLNMASEMQAYTLTDRATYLNMMENIDLEIIVEGDALMFNQYGVIPVNPELNEYINNDGANAFVQWLTSDETQAVIAEYGVEKFGMPLFTPNAQ